MVHYNIRVEGRVQGVFFRVFTQEEAKRLGLTGFVRNESDGSVYLEVEGDQDRIDQLVNWVSQGGPPRGEVTNYELTKGELAGFRTFDIQ